MTDRLQTFLTGMLAIIAAALLMFAPASANPTSGGYQLFGPVVHGVADDNPLIALEDFDHFAKVAPECCNAPNRTVSVDTSRATRGTPEYETLNNPPANTRVELDNGTTFRTNEAGYVEEISYQPVNQPSVRDSRQTAVGREGISGDVGGHIQACRHGGTCDRFNLFPQNSNFNNSSYRQWENEITRALQNGDDVGGVTVRFDRANPNSARPDSLRIDYEINGIPITRRFVNQAGGGQ